MDDFGRDAGASKSSRRRSRSRSRERDRRPSKRSRRDNKDTGTKGMKTFKEFSLSEPDDITPQEAIENYEKYKKSYLADTAKQFFEEHKGEEWFQELYNSKNEIFQLRSAITTKDDEQRQRLQKTVNAHAKRQLELFTTNIEQGIVVCLPFKRDDVGSSTTRTIIIRDVLATVSRADLSKLLKGSEESPTEAADNPLLILMSKYSSTNKFTRHALLVHGKTSNCERVCETLKSADVSFRMRCSILDNPPFPYLSAEYIKDEERVKKDLENTLQLVDAMDLKKGLEQDLFTGDFLDQKLTYKLNVVSAYLRSVHGYCYFTGLHVATLDQLLSHSFEEQEDEVVVPADWTETIDTRFASMLASIKDAKTTLEPAKDTEDEDIDVATKEKIEEFLNENTKQKSEGKFRCSVCQKLFRGSEFVGKHIRTKHKEEVDAIILQAAEVKSLQMYMDDPNKPYAVLKASTSHRDRGSERSRRDRNSSKGSTRRLGNDVREQKGYKGYEKQYGKPPKRSKGAAGRPAARGKQVAPAPPSLDGRDVIVYEEVSYKDADSMHDDAVDIDYGF